MVGSPMPSDFATPGTRHGHPGHALRLRRPLPRRIAGLLRRSYRRPRQNQYQYNGKSSHRQSSSRLADSSRILGKLPDALLAKRRFRFVRRDAACTNPEESVPAERRAVADERLRPAIFNRGLNSRCDRRRRHFRGARCRRGRPENIRLCCCRSAALLLMFGAADLCAAVHGLRVRAGHQEPATPGSISASAIAIAKNLLMLIGSLTLRTSNGNCQANHRRLFIPDIRRRLCPLLR